MVSSLFLYIFDIPPDTDYSSGVWYVTLSGVIDYNYYGDSDDSYVTNSYGNRRARTLSTLRVT